MGPSTHLHQLCSMTIQDGHEPRAEVTEVTSHSMDRKIQISAKEEPAEGQGTEKKTEYLIDPEVLTCMDSIP